MAWIVKIETPSDGREWYVTQIRKDKKNCKVISDRYHAKVYENKRFFEGLEIKHEVIEIAEQERHLYEHEKIDYRNFK